MENRFTHRVYYTLFAIMVAISIVFSLTFASERESKETNILFESWILKQRVYVLTFPHSGKIADEHSFIIKTEAWKTLLLKEGITIDTDDWAKAVDFLNLEISRSKVFRPVFNQYGIIQNLGSSATKVTINDLPLVLLAKFGVGIKGKGSFIYLIDGKSGNTLYAINSWEKSMGECIRKAVVELEEKVSFLAWRCFIMDRADNFMIIDRGRFDGIRKGQKFIGYRISQKQAGSFSMDLEFILMKYGIKVGIYHVIEEGEEFSKVAPMDNSPLLEVGDILEVPAIVLQDRERNIRGRKLWDNIYK